MVEILVSWKRLKEKIDKAEAGRQIDVFGQLRFSLFSLSHYVVWLIFPTSSADKLLG